MTSINKKSYYLIFLIPVIWGLGFPITHNAVSQVDAGIYAFFRSFIALLFITPFAIKYLLKVDKKLIVASLAFGLLIALQFVGQSNALRFLPSSATAFIISTNAIILIIFTSVLYKKKPEKIDVFSISLGVIGAIIILNPKFQQFNIGYWWAGLSSLAIALSILLIGYLSFFKDSSEPSAKVGDGLRFIFFQSLFCVFFLSYYPLSLGIPNNLPMQVWLSILYMGVIATVITTVLQIKFQNRIGNVRASLIYNLDVIFASVFGYLNHETMTATQLVGGSIIFLASIAHPVYLLAMRKYKTSTGSINSSIDKHHS
ncbi:DMT family transporter [Psychrobacter urativorans]|uniref:DMT family transporter n=1 Tax=Psychrobacter urativorans TaxID=45610 RepID=UPI00191B810C|nr:DMT family transporter [Psychrobacter urativorans]